MSDGRQHHGVDNLGTYSQRAILQREDRRAAMRELPGDLVRAAAQFGRPIHEMEQAMYLAIWVADFRYPLTDEKIRAGLEALDRIKAKCEARAQQGGTGAYD